MTLSSALVAAKTASFISMRLDSLGSLALSRVLFVSFTDLSGLSHPHEIVLLAQEGDLKALGWSPTNRPLARPVVSREEPPARPVGHRGKERARESAMKESHRPTSSAASFVREAAR